MRLRKKLILWMMLGAIVLCLAVPTVLIGQQLHQDSLDHALIQAVKKLDAPAVTRLLDQGASANARESGDQSLTIPRLLERLWLRLQRKTDSSGPLLSALSMLLSDERLHGYTLTPQEVASADAIAVSLIQHGAEVTVPSSLDKTPPLNVATWYHLHQTVRVLLSRGADVNGKDAWGNTPIIFASKEDAVLLLQHGADINNKSSPGGRTALVNALYRMDAALVSLLVAHGADVNASDDKGHSPLYLLMHQTKAFAGKTAIIHLLKQHGARLNKKEQEALKRGQP